MPVLLIGVNHTTAPVALRERLYIAAAAAGPLCARLCRLPGITEAVVLSTCNRTEVYAQGDAPEVLCEALAAYARLPLTEVAPHCFTFQEHEAVTHLFRVASGLDSEMLGETQILGQVRAALEVARAQGTASRHLIGLFQQAVAVGKRARTETAISDGAFSIGRAAVELARTLFPALHQSPILLVGAGKITELSARHLSAGGARAIFVANRTFARAEQLAERLGGQAIHFDRLEEALTDIDILISSTSAPHIVLSRETIAQAMARRGGRPLCLIDIAIPRDIDPAAATLPDVHLYNIDDLQAVADQDRERRVAEVPRVEAIITREVARWGQWQAGLMVAPVLSALHDAFDEIRRAEIARAANRLTALTAEEHDAVEHLTISIINKILHTPTMRVKEALADQQERLPLSTLCELFAIDAILHPEEREA